VVFLCSIFIYLLPKTHISSSENTRNIEIVVKGDCQMSRYGLPRI
jgi:hypothetical protein